MKRQRVIKLYLTTVKKFLGHIHRISNSYIPLTLLQMILNIGASFLNIVMPKFIIDELLGAQDTKKLVLMVGMVIGVNLLVNLTSAILDYALNIRQTRIEAGLDIILGNKSIELDFEQAENKDNLELKERASFVIHNQNAIGRMIGSIRSVTQNMIKIAGLLAIIITLDLWILLFIALILLISSWIFKNQNRSMFAINQELIPLNKIFVYYSGLTTDFSAGKDIRMYHMQPLIMKKIDAFIDTNLKGLFRMSQKEAKYQGLGAINLTLEIVCVYAYMCFKVLSGAIGIGDFSMYINAVNDFGSMISGLITQSFELTNMCQYLQPFIDFLDLQPTAPIASKDMTATKEDFKLEFEDVSFQYPYTSQPAVRHVNVTIGARERIAVVGLNGAGKTTFIKLLTRLYRPTSGVIRLNGVDINNLYYPDYISFFSAVFQDFKNYAFTIKENIALTATETSLDEDVWKELENVNLKDKVTTLPNGIQTSLYKIFDKEGIELSGGEMQKLAIARANFKKTPLILLDEPTSALDPLMEYEIMNAFNSHVDDRSVIYISHRLSSCKFCDRVLVFDHGEIVEMGSHADLMAIEDGLYRRMFMNQAQYYQ